MKTPFKVGDRVAIYCTKRTIQIIVDVSDEYIRWKGDDGYIYSAHPKQCRRLVKKKRRRIMVYKVPPPGTLCDRRILVRSDQLPMPDDQGADWTEFIEVRKKK